LSDSVPIADGVAHGFPDGQSHSGTDGCADPNSDGPTVEGPHSSSNALAIVQNAHSGTESLADGFTNGYAHGPTHSVADSKSDRLSHSSSDEPAHSVTDAEPDGFSHSISNSNADAQTLYEPDHVDTHKISLSGAHHSGTQPLADVQTNYDQFPLSGSDCNSHGDPGGTNQFSNGDADGAGMPRSA